MDWLDNAKTEFEASGEWRDNGHDGEARWRMAAAQTAALIALVERLDAVIQTSNVTDAQWLRVSTDW